MIRLAGGGSSLTTYIIPQFFVSPGSSWGQQASQVVNHNLNSSNIEVKLVIGPDGVFWQDPGTYYYADGPLRIKGWWADYTNANSLTLYLYQAATYNSYYVKGVITKFA